MIWPIVMVYKWYIDKGQLFRNQKALQNIITKYYYKSDLFDK